MYYVASHRKKLFLDKVSETLENGINWDDKYFWILVCVKILTDVSHTLDQFLLQSKNLIDKKRDPIKKSLKWPKQKMGVETKFTFFYFQIITL